MWDSKYKNINNLRVIAEKSYINYAWGVQYKGEAILSDGTIVKWSNYDTYPSPQEMTEKSNWIINNSDIKTEKLSQDGDNVEKNNSEYAIKCLKLIEKYL